MVYSSGMTNEQIAAVRAVAGMMVEAIGAAGQLGVGSGVLYSMLMGKLSLEQYNAIIGGLVRAGKITNDNHVLRVVGNTGK